MSFTPLGPSCWCDYLDVATTIHLFPFPSLPPPRFPSFSPSLLPSSSSIPFSLLHCSPSFFSYLFRPANPTRQTVFLSSLIRNGRGVGGKRFFICHFQMMSIVASTLASIKSTTPLPCTGYIHTCNILPGLPTTEWDTMTIPEKQNTPVFR